MALHLNTNHPFSIKGGTLSADELSRHAIDIAKEHKVSTNYNTILLNRLNNNFESITDIYKFFHEKHNQNTPLCPASEWLLDNYYIIEEQHKILLNQLDKSFFKQLLYLKNSIFKDLPRIFAVCYELVSHSDGRIDRDNLINFIESYQKVTPLTMQELWSLEPMLKLSLLEYISSICLKIYNIQNIWDKVFEFNNLTTDEIIDNVSEHLKNMESIDYHFLERVLIYTKKNFTTYRKNT
ncbi:hypothetical protein TCEA9_06150 [Thermobrachium celere]|nr:hypothetical protein TCEA9_06150 [Thermobrachium celere]